MAEPIVVEVSSKVAAPAHDVWAVASTMAGVNAELGPWIRMTHPPELSTLADIEGREAPLAFYSWLLLFGLIPIDRHHLGLERVLDDPAAAEGLGFDEESSSWLQKRWRHERRIVSSTGGGCTVTDRITVVPRTAITRPVVRRLIPAIFRRRHRRLATRFCAEKVEDQDPDPSLWERGNVPTSAMEGI